MTSVRGACAFAYLFVSVCCPIPSLSLSLLFFFSASLVAHSFVFFLFRLLFRTRTAAVTVQVASAAVRAPACSGLLLRVRRLPTQGVSNSRRSDWPPLMRVLLFFLLRCCPVLFLQISRVAPSLPFATGHRRHRGRRRKPACMSRLESLAEQPSSFLLNIFLLSSLSQGLDPDALISISTAMIPLPLVIVIVALPPLLDLHGFY